VLEYLAATAPGVASRRAIELEEAAQRLSASPSALTCRGAAHLWLALLQQRLIPAPSLAAVRHRLDTEHDVSTTAVLLRVIAASQLANDGEFDTARRLLDAAAAEAATAAEALRPGLGSAERQGAAVGQVYRHDQSVLALTELLAAHIDKVGVDSVIEAATRRPITVERIEMCSRLAERLANAGRASESATIIHAWGQVGTQETGAKRPNYARTSLHICAPHSVRCSGGLPRRSGTICFTHSPSSMSISRAVVDAACREQFLGSLPILVGLLDTHTSHGGSEKGLPSRVRRLILGYRYERERTRGNAGWPELLDLFRPLAASQS